LDATKLAGNAAHAANRTLPQIEKILAEAAETDAAEDAELGDQARPATPPALARRAERRRRLARARDRLAAEDQARRDAQRAKIEAWEVGKRRGQRPADEPRANRAGTEPRANLTDPDVRVMRTKKDYVCGYNGQLVVTEQQVIVGAMLSQHPVDRTLLHPLLATCRQQLTEAGIRPRLRTVLADASYASEDNFIRGEQQKLRLLVPLRKDPNLHPNRHQDSAPRRRCPPACEPGSGCVTTAARPTTNCAAKPWNPWSARSRAAKS
jgi:Transposase DDE domain